MRTSFITRSLALLIASGCASFGAGAQNLVSQRQLRGRQYRLHVRLFVRAGREQHGGPVHRALESVSWNGLFISAADHTSGSGLMYVGNGSPTNGSVVWASA